MSRKTDDQINVSLTASVKLNVAKVTASRNSVVVSRMIPNTQDTSIHFRSIEQAREFLTEALQCLNAAAEAIDA